jgi:hypothetical protein
MLTKPSPDDDSEPVVNGRTTWSRPSPDTTEVQIVRTTARAVLTIPAALALTLAGADAAGADASYTLKLTDTMETAVVRRRPPTSTSTATG